MYSLTQGTVISGIRSEKYPGTMCNGVVISARCDVANCKIRNIYYLVAVAVEDWLLTDEGFHAVLVTKVNELADKIETKLQKVGLDWNTLRNFSASDFEKVVRDDEVGLKQNADSCMESYKTYMRYQSNGLSTEERRSILQIEKKSVNKYLLSVVNGQVTHYVFVPQDAYKEDKCLDRGMIVDLQELDRFSIETAEIICSLEMDTKCKKLTDKQKDEYDKRFFLSDGAGYAMPEFNVKSPWIEYIMQHFSNSFIRIGVDGPQKKEIDLVIDRVGKGEE